MSEMNNVHAADVYVFYAFIQEIYTAESKMSRKVIRFNLLFFLLSSLTFLHTFV